MKLPLAILIVAGALTPIPSRAGTTTATMPVSLEIAQGCAMTTGPLAFDDSASAQATLRLRCTPGAAYSVMLDEGSNGRRRMVGDPAAEPVAYEIYQDAHGRRRWGANITEVVFGTAPAGGEMVLTAHGRAAASGAAAPGSYWDVVTVTVAF